MTDIKGVDLYRRGVGKELGEMKELKTNQHICMRKYLLLKKVGNEKAEEGKQNI